MALLYSTGLYITRQWFYHRRFQTWASLGIARVKRWSIVLIAYHYIVLRDDGAEFSDAV